MHPRRHVRMSRTESGYIAAYWNSWIKRFRHNWHPMSVWIPGSKLPCGLLFRWTQSGNLRMENRLSMNRLLVHHFYIWLLPPSCRRCLHPFWTHNHRADNRRIFHWPHTISCSSCFWWCQRRICICRYEGMYGSFLPVWFHFSHNGWDLQAHTHSRDHCRSTSLGGRNDGWLCVPITNRCIQQVCASGGNSRLRVKCPSTSGSRRKWYHRFLRREAVPIFLPGEGNNGSWMWPGMSSPSAFQHPESPGFSFHRSSSAFLW